MTIQIFCPYCGSQASLESSTKVYGGRDYGLVYVCANYPKCDAYVGVHNGTVDPLGRLANAELRHWKSKVHTAFDPLWKNKLLKIGKGCKNRRAACYGWLAEKLGITLQQCHIGMFDIEMCKKAYSICVHKAIYNDCDCEDY